MNYFETRVTLDIAKNGVQASVILTEGENGRTLFFTLRNGAAPMAITPGMRAKLYARKPDGTEIYHGCVCYASDSAYPDKAVYTVKPQTVSSPGVFEARLIISDEFGRVLYSPRFSFVVERNGLLDSSLTSEDDFSALVADASAAIAAKTAAEDAAEASEAARDEARTAKSEAVRAKEEAMGAESAAEAAQEASEKSAAEAATSKKDAITAQEAAKLAQGAAEVARTGAEVARAGAEVARDAIEGMTVSGVTLDPSLPVKVEKTIVDGVVHLTFSVPSGKKGDKGDRGEKGDAGAPFTVAKTYPSVDAMNAGFETDGVAEGSFVAIDTGNVEDAENARLYMKGKSGYLFITDLSGTAGIKGDKGDKGDPREVVQDIGQSTEAVMSQKAVTDCLESKVEKPTSVSGIARLYGVKTNSKDTVFFQVQTSQTYKDSIPKRGANGTFAVGTPTNPTDAVNKKYVDNKLFRQKYISTLALSNGETYEATATGSSSIISIVCTRGHVFITGTESEYYADLSCDDMLSPPFATITAIGNQIMIQTGTISTYDRDMHYGEICEATTTFARYGNFFSDHTLSLVVVHTNDQDESEIDVFRGE